MWLQEIYSIKLPGEVILGEGKPENQNHAIVFTRGEAIQTIDMNQVCCNWHNVVLLLCCYHHNSVSKLMWFAEISIPREMCNLLIHNQV